ncbi:MAG: hypothetical protein AAF763_16895, partial [Pseudomonadota bacterium]
VGGQAGSGDFKAEVVFRGEGACGGKVSSESGLFLAEIGRGRALSPETLRLIAAQLSVNK